MSFNSVLNKNIYMRVITRISRTQQHDIDNLVNGWVTRVARYLTNRVTRHIV